jgi:hypothetical protein
MKGVFKKFGKSKKPKHDTLGSNDLATSTSTIITSNADLMPSVPASAAIPSVQAIQAAGVTVSVQFAPSHG